MSTKRSEALAQVVREQLWLLPGREVAAESSDGARSADHDVMNVIEWLLESDPAIRWQVMGDLTDASREQVAAERARIATEGWGAELLSMQGEDGVWRTRASSPTWSR